LSKREVLVCAAVLACGLAVLPFVGGSVLWTHPLWLDELCCTLIPTEAASPAGVVTNILHRQEMAPPLLHLIVWTVKTVAGGMTPGLLRGIATVCVALALIFTYAGLRRHFDRASSACGALTVASHPLVLFHAFEGRFYGPWLLFAAGYAWAVGKRDRVGAVLQGVFAVAVVTIHWFGVLSLGLMAAAVVASHGRRWRDGVRAILPTTAGPVALLMCLPLLAPQREGIDAFQWLPDFAVGQLRDLTKQLLLTAVTALAAGLLVVEALRHDRPGPRAVLARVTDALRRPELAALTGLAALPLVLAVLSVTLQPAMLGRYGIVAILSVAPLVAFAVSSLGRVAQVVALIAVLAPFRENVQAAIAERRGFTERVQGDLAAYSRVRDLGVPVAWPWLQSIWPVVGPTRHNPGPAVFLDVPDSAVALLYPGDRIAWLRRRIRVEVTHARSHQIVYGFPRVVTTADLDTVKRFAVMTSDLRIRGGTRQAELWGRIVFPRHQVVRVDDQVSFFERVR
jgi:hypothetical protein